MVIVSRIIVLFLHTKLTYKGKVFLYSLVEFIFVYVCSNDDQY